MLFHQVLHSQFWNPTSALNPTDNITALTVNSNGKIFAANWAKGVYTSTNHGLNWTLSGLSGLRPYALECAPNDFVFALQSTQTALNIHRTTNGGVSWQVVMNQSITNNFASGGSIVFVNDSVYVAAMSLTVGPTIGDVAGRIFRSTDRGATWNQITNIVAGFTEDLVLTPTGRILAATSLGGVKASDNNGSSWMNTGYNIYSNTLAVNSLGHVFVGRWTAGDTSQMVFRSTDNGALWFPTTCTGGNVRALMVDDDVLYVANENKVVRKSTDGGNTWEFISSGLPNTTFVQSLAASPNGILYAGTTTLGVFKSGGLVPVVNLNENASEFSLNQNYPNPFNPLTKIKFTVPNAVKVNLIVYNALGSMIETLLNHNLSQGSYEIEFNSDALPTGVYFYKLTAGEFSVVKKMMLVK